MVLGGADFYRYRPFDMELVKNGQTVIGWDPPGQTGLSENLKDNEGKPKRHTMVNYGEFQNELFNALIEGKVNIIAMSMGGIPAALFAGAHPDKVNKLVLADTFATMKNRDFVQKVRGIWGSKLGRKQAIEESLSVIFNSLKLSPRELSEAKNRFLQPYWIGDHLKDNKPRINADIATNPGICPSTPLLQFTIFIRLFVLTAGFITPFVITLLPFVLSGALSDFWVNVFERNLSYSSWENSFRIYYLIFLIIVLPLFYYFRKRFSPAFTLLFLWFFLAVLGSRISIRPYTHYLIQVLPSLSLIVFFIIFDIRRNFLLAFVPLFFYLALVPQFPLNRGSVGYQLGYYRNFIDYKSGKINITVYRSFFDPHVPRTYAVADYLKANTLPGQPTFIWGDDALIYDLSDRPPIGKYIVAYITPIWDSNFKETVHDLVIKQPLYILVSTERIDVFPFPFLTKFLSENYKKDVQFADIIVYKRIIP